MTIRPRQRPNARAWSLELADTVWKIPRKKAGKLSPQRMPARYVSTDMRPRLAPNPPKITTNSTHCGMNPSMGMGS